MTNDNLRSPHSLVLLRSKQSRPSIGRWSELSAGLPDHRAAPQADCQAGGANHPRLAQRPTSAIYASPDVRLLQNGATGSGWKALRFRGTQKTGSSQPPSSHYILRKADDVNAMNVEEWRSPRENGGGSTSSNKSRLASMWISALWVMPQLRLATARWSRRDWASDSGRLSSRVPGEWEDKSAPFCEFRGGSLAKPRGDI